MELHTEEKEQDSAIFIEIAEAEKKADEIIESAIKEKEKLINDAKRNLSSLILKTTEEIDKGREKKIQDFQSNAYVLKEGRLDEAKGQIKKFEQKPHKNMQHAVDIVFSRFVGYIKNKK